MPQENAAPTLRWLGTGSWTADQLLASTRPLLGAVDMAKAFLLDMLAAAPRTSREIWDAAKKRNFSDSTVERARQQLDITSDRGWLGKDFVSYWCLPKQTSPLAVADPACADFDDFLRRYHEQYPPPTPLDDG